MLELYEDKYGKFDCFDDYYLEVYILVTNKKMCLLVTAMMLFSGLIMNMPITAKAADNDLRKVEDVLYFVNAGDPTPEKVGEDDQLGIYQSQTEQMYGTDEGTGKKWGLVTETTATSNFDEGKSDKYSSLRYYNGPQSRDKAIEYKFELPEGNYDLTLGFKNKWSGRNVNIIAEGENLSNGDYDIGEYGAEKEFNYRQLLVKDGELTLKIQGPESAELTNHNDPLVNYIFIKESVLIPLSDLIAKIVDAREKVEEPNPYTNYSVQQLQAAIDQGAKLLDSITNERLDVESRAVQEDIYTTIHDVDTAIGGLELYKENESFKPGQTWKDTDGKPIQSHGSGIMYDEQMETYYWYGEDKTHGYLPARGVRVYSSKDLYNWEDEGLALTAIESMDQFADDPLISKLYTGRDDKEAILNDIGTDRVIERPKVIYNEKTKKYVMWMHIDGPSETSDAMYAKAHAGYALSDSPAGPFVYQESNRMDRAPEDADYNGQPDQPGMARDMTLFKDDDGTAYLIYSSEENMTIYISKLNDSYTDVVGWHKEGKEERDSTYKAVHGEDYIRVFPGAQREAPALFKYQEKYYMITSGATGWDPNPARYTVADDIFGEWKPMRNPAVGEKASTTFDSQSTHVIPVDPENGEFIYMGDRWKKEDLANSSYVWLPIEFGQEDEMILRWYDEWDLSILDKMGRVTINSKLPEKVTLGKTPDLPDVINVTNTEGKQMDTSVIWEINDEDFSQPGMMTVEGKLPELADKVVRIEILVLPNNVEYFVHAGGAETRDYKLWASYMPETLLNKDRIDQQYDPENGQNWGYVGDRTSPSGSEDGDLFSALRYLTPNSGTDLTYKFNLDNGEYTVYLGLYDPWYSSTRGSRKVDILFNEEVHTKDYVFTDAYDVAGGDVEIADNLLDVTIRKTNTPDPQISWIMIVGDEQKQDVNVSKMLETLMEYKADLQDSVYHSLQVHLTALQHYERQEEAEKTVKHMNSFIELLEHQKEKGLVSDDMFKVLKRDAQILIAHWQ